MNLRQLNYAQTNSQVPDLINIHNWNITYESFHWFYYHDKNFARHSAFSEDKGKKRQKGLRKIRF
jgi:hypothetical protein